MPSLISRFAGTGVPMRLIPSEDPVLYNSYRECLYNALGGLQRTSKNELTPVYALFPFNIPKTPEVIEVSA